MRKKKPSHYTKPTCIAALTLFAVACLADDQEQGETKGLVHAVTGFSGPESVRYDPQQDVFFVSNFNGESAGDANAFVSKLSADGQILELEFMRGSDRWPFHGGRGMYLSDPGLWVVDAQGVHLFDRESGVQLEYVDFSGDELGFLNDIVLGDDGAMYVTDTGTSTLYRLIDGVVSVAAATPIGANGITRSPHAGNLLLVPWSGPLQFYEWNIVSGQFTPFGNVSDGGNYDGVEYHDGVVITASQEDSSLHFMIDGVDRRSVPLAGRPADIGIDTRRNRVAVPYVGLDRVDIISLDAYKER